jgi:hypothetical protein
MLKYPGCYQDLKRITHFWIYRDDAIEIVKGEHYNTHYDHFGDDCEYIDERGYFYENKCVVTCHTFVNRYLLNKLERAFDKAGLNAIYIYQNMEQEICE